MGFVNHRKWLLGAVLGSVVALAAMPSWSQAAVPAPVGMAAVAPNQKLMAKRAAQLDAYRQLTERIMGLQISSGTTVRDFVTESDQIGTSIEGFIKGVKLGEPRYFDDGTCEVDAEVTIVQVVTAIEKAYDEVYKGGKWQRSDIENITKTTTFKTISVTGAGAVRAQSLIPDPAQAEIVKAVLARQVQHIELPAICAKYPPNERLKAKRAAELDAYRLLMEPIYGLQIVGDTTVKDFVTASDQIQTSIEGTLKGVRTMDVRYGSDGVVEVQMQVTIAQVVTAIEKSYDEVY